MGCCSSKPATQEETQEKLISGNISCEAQIDKVQKGKILNSIKSLVENVEEKVEEKVVDSLEKICFDISVAIEKVHISETVIPNVFVYKGLHQEVEEIFRSEFPSELGVVKRSAKLKKTFDDMEGKPRTLENYRPAWEAIAKSLGIDAKTSFPEKITPTILKNLVAHNAFISSGLSFEEGKVCFNATKHSKNPIVAKVFSCFKGIFAVSKLYISEDFSKVELYIDGHVIPYEKDSPKWEKACSVFITCLLYYFELLHAVIHVYAYAMLNAALHACDKTEMNDFMVQYEQKVLIKYIEVKVLLLSKNGIVAGGVWPVNHDATMSCATDLFKHFASATNAEEWFYNILLGGVSELRENKNILPQCRLYLPLFGEMSTKACEMVKEVDQIDKKIVEFLGYSAGPEKEGYFKLKTFKEWIECQSMMGILHGNTLNLTRLMFTPYFQGKGEWDLETIGAVSGTWVAAAATLMGLEAEHAIAEDAPFKKETTFHKMMSPFNEKCGKIQEKFWNSVDEEDKRLYGWIYSVWGPNMENETQLTVTTYV